MNCTKVDGLFSSCTLNSLQSTLFFPMYSGSPKCAWVGELKYLELNTTMDGLGLQAGDSKIPVDTIVYWVHLYIVKLEDGVVLLVKCCLDGTCSRYLSLYDIGCCSFWAVVYTRLHCCVIGKTVTQRPVGCIRKCTTWPNVCRMIVTYHAFVYRCRCIEIDRGCSLEQRDHAIKESMILLVDHCTTGSWSTGVVHRSQLCSEHPRGGEILLVCSTGVAPVVLQYHQYFQSCIGRVYMYNMNE